MENIKRSNGITLIALVITIIIMLIFSTTLVRISMNSLQITREYNFVTELEMAEKRMSVINKEIQLGSTAYTNIGTKYVNLNDEIQSNVRTILSQNGISNYDIYTYLTQEDLSKLGLKNISRDVIICYGVSNTVYSYEGIKVNGNLCYSIKEVNDNK